MDIETKIQEIKDEQSEINNNVTLLELFTKMPWKNLYRNYEMFEFQVLHTEGQDIYDKYINFSRNKCKIRINYLENKVNSFEEYMEIKNDEKINETLQEMIDELNYEKEALEYFNEFYN